MVRRYLYPAESEHLFFYLEQLGVRIHLNVSDQEKATNATDSLVKNISDWRRPMMIDSIALATRELLKPKEVNEDIIEQVIQLYENVRPAEDEDEKLGEESAEEDLPDPECDDFDFDFGVDHVARAREKAKEAVPTEQDMMELLEHCKAIGCSMKPGQEQNILHLMISFFSSNGTFFTRFSSDEADRAVCIEVFMKKVQDYINSCCIRDLTDLGTVHCAIQIVKLKEEEEDFKKEQQRVSSMLKKNIVPTKEEGITTPMYLLKLEEKTECGDMELDESRERKYVEC
ncbi:hypothetical protein ABKV19_011270 [Rosa sericea]